MGRKVKGALEETYEGDGTYLLCGDHDSYLFNSLGKLLWLYCTIVIEIEIFE